MQSGSPALIIDRSALTNSGHGAVQPRPDFTSGPKTSPSGNTLAYIPGTKHFTARHTGTIRHYIKSILWVVQENRNTLALCFGPLYFRIPWNPFCHMFMASCACFWKQTVSNKKTKKKAKPVHCNNLGPPNLPSQHLFSFFFQFWFYLT